MEKVKEFILKNNLINKGEVIGVGVSGGADSMALLSILKSLEEELDFEVVGIHINHGIRPESSREADFVINKCKSMGVRAYKFNIDSNKIAKEKNLSLETAAREGRYEVFKSLIKKDVVDKIALAHHQSDQAETILMHLFRGSGSIGMRGMEASRDNIYIRPILELSKEEILAYNHEHNIDFVQDQSNFDNSFNRNFVRNVLMPNILSRWPGAENAIINFSKTMAEDEAFIDQSVNDDAVIYDNDYARIPTSYFIYPASIVNRLVMRVLKKLGFVKDFERKHIELIKDLALNKENGTRIKLPFDLTVIKEYDYVTIIFKEKKDLTFSSEFSIGEVSVPYFGKIVTRRVKKQTKENTLYVDPTKIPKTAVWRFKQEGDSFTKFGGGTKKLKSYLVDKKIPARMRETLPVLADGNDVLVIAGIEISDKVKLDEGSKIVEIEVKKN